MSFQISAIFINGSSRPQSSCDRSFTLGNFDARKEHRLRATRCQLLSEVF